MTRNMHRRVVAGASLAVLLLGSASIAWACTRSPTIYLSPAFGQSGSQTQVNGGSFLPGEPVEIHWGSKDGPVIGRATTGANSSFSVPVVIPPGRDGVYYVVATAPGSRGQASFEVSSRVSRNSDPEPQPERQTSTSGNGSEASGSTGGGQTSGSTTGGDSSRPGSGQQSGDIGFAEQPQNASQATAAPSAQSSSANQAAQPATGGAGARPGDAVSTGDPTTGPGGAIAPAPSASDEDRSPTPRTVTADLWSGFSSANTGSLLPNRDNPAPATNGATPLAVGVALLGAGIAALGLGFGAAELRRKRVLVGSNT